MQIFQGNEAEIKQKFKLSPIAVMWVGLLRGKNISITEPVLELCQTGGPLEPLIKDRSLLSSLDDPQKFGKLQEKYDPQRDFPMVILEQGTSRVLALQDEVVAESAWEKEKTIEKTATEHPLQRIDMVSSSPQVHLQGLENLFPSEEIVKLKIAIATTVKAEEKIEAIRKMVLAQVPLDEKTILFLHAIGDGQGDVRSEAAKALKHIGFDPEIAEALISMNQADSRQRQYAIGRLGQLFKEAKELERGAILQIFLTLLQDKYYRPEHVSIVEVLAKVVPEMSTHSTAMFERILLSTVEAMVSRLDDFVLPSIQLFNAASAQIPQLVSRFLWNEVEGNNERRLRAFLLYLLVEANTDSEKEESLAEKIAYEISLGDELDSVYLKLTGAMVALSEKAVKALLNRFNVSIRGTEKMQIVKLLDKILSEKSIRGELKNQVLKSYLEVFPTAPDALRQLILLEDLFQDPEVSVSLKQEFALEALVDVHKERIDLFQQMVKACLCRMQKASIDPLLKVIKKPLHPGQALVACEILGDVVLYLPVEDKEEAEKIEEFCLRQLKGTPDYRGELFKVLGKIAHAPSSIVEMSDKIADYLMEHLCKTGCPYEILESLGWAASGKHTSEKTKMDICYIFMALMNQKLPDRLLEEKKDIHGGKIFQFNLKTTAYTELLPVLTLAFERLGTCPSISASLRKSIVDYLLRKWSQVVEYKVIWGPKNVLDLAHAMTGLSLHPDVFIEDRLSIVKALYLKIDVFSIGEMLSSIFPKQSDESLALFALKSSMKFLEFANSPEYKSPEDREVIMRCIGNIVVSEKLAPSHKASEEMREKLLYALFEATRDEVIGIKAILYKIQKSPHISKKFQKEIGKRLSSKMDEK